MAETLADEPSIDPDKLSYEIFSILETNFLFGYDNQKLWLPKHLPPAINHANNGTAHPIPIKHQRGKICILTIDGNGMRSILSGKTLSYLETALKSKSSNPAATIPDYFDVAAGTGVGGIFTAMLFAGDDRSRPIFHADDTWKLLEKHGKRFHKRKGFCKFRFGQTGMEKVMKEAFADKKTGRCLTLKDTVKPVLIPCYDLSSTAPFLFSRADALETDSYDFKLWEVCLATSADASVFEPVRMKSVDGLTSCVGVGGELVMSNPTVAAITHVLHNKQEFPHVRGVEDILVLSVGAGGLVVEGGFEYEEVKKWRGKEWAKMRARISSDGSAELVDHAVAMAYGESRSSNYVRIQANGSSSTTCGADVDSDTSPSNVKTLIEKADEMLKQKNVESVLFSGKRIGEQSNAEKLDWFAEQLVLEHQRRSSRIAPTVAFKQATSTNLSS